jgi:hypothetical protein
MKQQSVSFDDRVLVQKHALTVGDNPACYSGTPVQLAWDREALHTASLAVQERRQENRYGQVIKQRQRRRLKSEPVSQGPPVQKLSYYDRQKILRKAGHTDEEILLGERATDKVRRQREWTEKQTIPVRTALSLQRLLKTPVTARHRKRVVKEWNQHYDGSNKDESSDEKPEATTTTTAVEEEENGGDT